MILSAIKALGPWVWYVLALLLFALEVAVPGTFFLWFGISALFVGSLNFFIDLSWQIDLIIFIVLAFASFALSYKRLKRRQKQTPSLLNRRGLRYVGRRFLMENDLKAGAGRLKIDDTIWRVTGPDTPSGTLVEVVGCQGVILQVKPVDEEKKSLP